MMARNSWSDQGAYDPSSVVSIGPLHTEDITGVFRQNVDPNTQLSQEDRDFLRSQQFIDRYGRRAREVQALLDPPVTPPRAQGMLQTFNEAYSPPQVGLTGDTVVSAGTYGSITTDRPRDLNALSEANTDRFRGRTQFLVSVDDITFGLPGIAMEAPTIGHTTTDENAQERADRVFNFIQAGHISTGEATRLLGIPPVEYEPQRLVTPTGTFTTPNANGDSFLIGTGWDRFLGRAPKQKPQETESPRKSCWDHLLLDDLLED